MLWVVYFTENTVCFREYAFIGNPINLRRLYWKRWLVRWAANITGLFPAQTASFQALKSSPVGALKVWRSNVIVIECLAINSARARWGKRNATVVALTQPPAW